MNLYGHGISVEKMRADLRCFVDELIIPRESAMLEDDIPALESLIAELRAKAQALGIWGPLLKSEWGGMALNWRDAQVFLEEACRSPLGPYVFHCNAPDGPNILTLEALCTPAQREKYLAPLVDGRMRACFQMTEPHPGAGSDPGMLQTRAVRRNGKWVINGHKWYSSGANVASFGLLLAQSDDGPGIFLVDTRNNPGWRLRRVIRSLHHNPFNLPCEVDLVDCAVEDDAVLGEVGRGFEYAQLRLEPARLAHCMRHTGRAVRCVQIAQDYVNKRHSFRQRLADLQNVQSLIADAHIEINASRLMTWQVAALMDAGQSVKHESAMAKVFVSEALGRVIDRAMQLTGALGNTHDTPMAGYYQEVRGFRVADGASEVHRAAIGIRALRRNLRP
jgi:acyl-CoA dehydrogenase